MIDTLNIEQAKNLIKKEKHDKISPIIVIAKDDNFNRKILEYGNFDILLSPEAGYKERTLRQIDSGLNHTLASIAAKNKISIGIDLDKLKNMEKKEKALMIERIIQNIKLCKKAKVPLKILNFKDRKNAFAFLISLGASTQQAKEAF
ncbi:MAG: hypothetical protein QXS38_01385 [Candidatus Pacearchaeota archaeon]